MNSVELAIARVALRVASGGHDIPEDVIRRRYHRGRKNFWELYSKIADSWVAYDNTTPKRKLIAEKIPETEVIIYQADIWQDIQQKSI